MTTPKKVTTEKKRSASIRLKRVSKNCPGAVWAFNLSKKKKEEKDKKTYEKRKLESRTKELQGKWNRE